MAVVPALRASTSNSGISLEEAFNAKDITTAEMNTAIQSWFEWFYERQKTDEQDPSQRIPYIVVTKLTRTVFSEFEASSQNAFAQTILDAFVKVRKKGMQRVLIGGEALLKPLFFGGEWRFSVIDRQNYLVFGRNEEGELTDIGTSEETTTGSHRYTLLERRHVDEKGYLTIENRLYRSKDSLGLGSAVPLSSLPKYADLEATMTFQQPIGSIGLIPIRTPMENCVDGSDDSISVYEPAMGLIELIAINEAQLSGEFDRGESRVIASGDMMMAGDDGKPRFDDHIFTGLPGGPDEIGITIFSPAFREQSFLARKAEYLRNVESLIGFKRGILSEVEAAERTATEITSSAGDYSLTIKDFQNAFEGAIREAVRLCGILGKIYSVPGAADVKDDDVIISFGNGILYDEDKVWEQYRDMAARGLIKPEIAVAWYFNISWETEADLAEIREKYMPMIEDLENADA